MANDSYTEVSSQSWFGRIGGAIKGVVFGLALFVASFVLLFWNEGRAVRTHKTLDEGARAVVSVAADRVDPANAGRLVHLTGEAATEEAVADPVFGISVNAVKLKRVVEMYQWKETEKSTTRKKVGGGTETTKTYTYGKAWSERLIDSTEFRKPEEHGNPGAMPYETAEWTARTVSLGAFLLSRSLVDRIADHTPLPVTGVAVPAGLPTNAAVQNAGFYVGSNPSAPQVGDLRVTFRVVKPQEVSVIARQVGETFEPYRTAAGGTIEMLQTGTYSADAMIERAEAGNRMLTWILRLVGFVLMFAGLAMIFAPLSVLADVLPILGSIVGAGTGIVAFLVSLVLSLATIGIAWIVYRPLLGVGLLAAGAAVAIGVTRKLRKRPPAE